MPRQRPISQFEHTDKARQNNPPVGLVTADANGRVAVKIGEDRGIESLTIINLTS